MALFLSLMLWMGIIGLFADWRYVRKGGQRPTGTEKRLLLSAVVLGVIFLMRAHALALDNGQPERWVILTSGVILFLWAGLRRAVRRRVPLQKSA